MTTDETRAAIEQALQECPSEFTTVDPARNAVAARARVDALEAELREAKAQCEASVSVHRADLEKGYEWMHRAKAAEARLAEGFEGVLAEFRGVATQPAEPASALPSVLRSWEHLTEDVRAEAEREYPDVSGGGVPYPPAEPVNADPCTRCGYWRGHQTWCAEMTVKGTPPDAFPQRGIDYRAGCTNSDCECWKPGKPCEEWQGDADDFCPRCGWAERHHPAPAAQPEPPGEPRADDHLLLGDECEAETDDGWMPATIHGVKVDDDLTVELLVEFEDGTTALRFEHELRRPVSGHDRHTGAGRVSDSKEDDRDAH